jgi:hypothetical protein
VLPNIPFLNHTRICAAGKLHAICRRPFDIPNRIRIALERLQHSKRGPIASLHRRPDIKALDGSILACREQPIVLEGTYSEPVNLPRLFLNTANFESFSNAIEIIHRDPSIP